MSAIVHRFEPRQTVTPQSSQEQFLHMLQQKNSAKDQKQNSIVRKQQSSSFRGMRFGSTGQLISGENTIVADASAQSKPTRFDSNGQNTQDSHPTKKRDPSSSIEKEGDYAALNSLPSSSNFIIPSDAQMPPSYLRETPFKSFPTEVAEF